VIRAVHAHFTPISAAIMSRARRVGCAQQELMQVDGLQIQVNELRWGAGERDRTADLPFTRRPLCQLSYTGGGLLHGSRSRP
jgi:hypothetical protein